MTLLLVAACGGSSANDATATDSAVEATAADGDAIPDAVADAAETQAVDAPVDATSEGVVGCGSSACSLSTESCCATPNGASEQFTCVSRGSPCAGGVASCDGPEDCVAGEVCCSTFGSGALPNEACTAASSCSGSGATRACHDPSQCPSGWMCCPGASFGFSGSYCAPTCS